MLRKVLIALGLMLIGGAVIASAAAEGPYLFDVLKHRPSYRKAWDALLAGSRPIPAWITRFSRNYDGVTAPSEKVMVDGVTYEAFNLCKPHDCYDNQLEVFFTPGAGKAYGALVSPHGSTPRFLGAPSTAVSAALAKAFEQ
jgi:hypothetical protein